MINTRNWLNSKLDERLKFVRASEDDKTKALLIETAREDPVFFINNFCWTYDPRKEAYPHHFPFLTYEFQDDYVRQLERSFQASKDLLTEKSRDVGASWLALTWILWHWIFNGTFNALIGSRKEALVDNRELDSLFGKLDYQIRRLPAWILPKGFNIDKHRTFCRLTNPESGAAIQGESANTEFSRQGRYSVILLDEFAFWGFATSCWTATADTAPVRFPISTPNGKANKFAELRFAGDIQVMSLHWTLHPFKDQDWYELEKKRRTPREIAQELDMDYESSGNERIFPEMLANKKLRLNVYIEPFEIPENWRLTGGLDYGTRNKSVFTVFATDQDGNEYAIWEWRKNMEDLRLDGFSGSMVQGIALAIKKCPYFKDLYIIKADPSLWAKTQNTDEGLVSIENQLYELGIKLLEKGAQSDRDCIQRVKTLWSNADTPGLKIFKTCPGLMTEIEDLMWDDWTELTGYKKNTKETIVDKNNHSWDVLKYFLLSRPVPLEIGKAITKRFSPEWWLNQTKKEGGKAWQR